MLNLAVAAVLMTTSLPADTGRIPFKAPDRFMQALEQTDTPAVQHAVEHSDAYYTRLTIHKYASFAMIPLFAAEYYVGQKLYNGTASESLRSLHGPLAAGVIGLFGVNTITGVWNLVEARHDPEGRTKRTIHSIMMMAADAGFVATAALTPEGEHRRFNGFVEGESGGTSKTTHRNLAVGSMSVAVASWILMLIPTGD